MSTSKKKCRQYSTDYLKYGFITHPTNDKLPLCLLCQKTLTNEAMKPSRLMDHLSRIHPDKQGKPREYFQEMKAKYEKQVPVNKLFTKTIEKTDKGLLASYKVSLLIAKAGKPHTIGEQLILPAVREIIDIMIGPSATNITQAVPLSNSTVSRRIDEMGSNIEDTLCNKLKNREFTCQIDESTLSDSTALLLCYVRFIDDHGEMEEELLFARNLTTDTKGSSIFDVVKGFFEEKGIPLTNMIACATDGAAAMTGRHRGFIALLKQAVPNILCVHCVIHREHLAAKKLSGKLYESLHYVIDAVNKIKAQPKNDRIFRQLCEENDETFKRLLLHTEVRWLSKGNCLGRFFNLIDTVVEFLENVDPRLSVIIHEIRTDIAYLSDIFERLNEVNLQLQGPKINMIKAKGIVCSFIEKLKLMKNSMYRKDLNKFKNLKSIFKESDDGEKLEIYCLHLENLQKDLCARFQDLTALEVPHWVLNPFTAETSMVPESIQESLIDIKYDIEKEALYNSCGYEKFWSKIKETCPDLWNEVKLLVLAFPTTYLVEKGFSAVSYLKSKSRNKLDISQKGDLRLFLTGMTPDIESLCQSHQAQGSH